MTFLHQICHVPPHHCRSYTEKLHLLRKMLCVSCQAQQSLLIKHGDLDIQLRLDMKRESLQSLVPADRQNQIRGDVTVVMSFSTSVAAVLLLMTTASSPRN